MSRPNGATNLAVLAVGVLLGVAALASPRPQRDPSPSDFSLATAVAHVEVIAQEPHPLGSVESRRVREYLIESLRDSGWELQVQDFTAPDFYGTPGNTVELANVAARLPGTNSSGSILLMAHYDTVPQTAGANDNSASVAAVLETARALAEGDRLANEVIVLFTDAEEPYGRAGANAFIGGHPWADEVAFVMNFEASGGSGPAMLAQTGPAQPWTIEQLANVSRPVAFSFITDIASLFGEVGTDFDPFLALGTEGVHFAFLRGGSIYHTERDSLDALHRDGVLHHGSYALSLTRHLGDLDLGSPPPPSRSTFFTLWPGGLVRYSTSLAVAVAVLALAGAVTCSVVDVQRRGRAPTRVVAQAGWVVIGALAGSILAGLLWMAIAAVRPTMGSVEAYTYLALLVAVGLLVRTLLGRRFQRPDAPSGVMLVWALLAVALVVLLPGASYLLAWPAVAAAVAYLTWPNPSPNGRLVRLGVVGVVMGLVMIPAVDFFLALAQPRPGNLDSEMTESFVLVAFVSILCWELLLPFLRTGEVTEEPNEASAPAKTLVAAA